MDVDDYITAREAAAIIGCVPSRVRQLAQGGELTARKLGRDWLVLRASAEAYRDSAPKPGPKPKGTKPKGGT